jgi:fructose-bisphosphate aldolase class II
MPIASPEVYAEMLNRAKAGHFAYPAINCTSSQTIVAAIRGFAEAESDGIVQFSWGGAEFASGQAVKSMVAGAVALAEFAHSIAAHYDVNIALHTDHCPKDKLPGFMEPLLKVSQERVAKGLEPLFQSHMWDGSAVPLKENLEISQRMLEESVKARTILEIEIGVDGRVTVRTKGIKGEACRDYAAAVAKIIGRIETSEPTAELYETPDVVRRVIDIHNRR